MARRIGERMLRLKRPSVILLLAMLFKPTVVLSQLEVIGGSSARLTDNARKTESNEKSDLETRAYLTATYASDPGQCRGSFGGTLGYTIWQKDAFESETDANADLVSECELAPTLFWDLTDNLREVSQDNTQANTPANRTRKNVFRTGPRYIWRLGTADAITFDAKYENTEFGEPEEADSERYIGSVAWTHLIGPTSRAGIDAFASRAELDTGVDVDVQTIQLTAGKAWPTTSFSGALGVSEIETSAGPVTRSSDGVVGELEVTRELNPSATWYLRGARELTDRTSSFDIRFEDFEFNLEESLTVEVSALSTGVDKVFSDQSSLNVRAFFNQTELLEADEREESAGFDLRYSRDLTPRLNGYTGIGFRYSMFEQDGSDDRTTDLELGLNYLFSRELSGYGKLGHEHKTSDVSTREFQESWLLVGIEYRFL